MLIPEGRDISDRKQIEAALQLAHDDLEVRVQERTAELKQANAQLTSEIVERQRAEEALRSSYATNRALLNAIPDWMCRINAEGMLVNYKAADPKLLPVPSEELIGRTVFEIFPEAVAQPLIACVQQVLRSHEVEILEYQLFRDQQLMDYEARLAVSAEQEVMAIIRDITERKQAERDIQNALAKERELNELKSRFVAMTSHEFRTPLSTILSSAELLEHYSHQWPDNKKNQHLNRIQLAVQHMTGMLNDVLLLGKIEAEQLRCDPSPMQLTEFCTDLVECIQITTENHDLLLQVKTHSDTVLLDEKLLKHILDNLLSNAIKYSPQGGLITLDILQTEAQIVLQVQDYGLGIPSAEQEQIFNSFNRASNVGNISGTGLGLAIVKKAVDLQGGKIEIDSAEGVGTKFTITLPIHHSHS
jgi:PAS domain S-box-containing protein